MQLKPEGVGLMLAAKLTQKSSTQRTGHNSQSYLSIYSLMFNPQQPLKIPPHQLVVKQMIMYCPVDHVVCSIFISSSWNSLKSHLSVVRPSFFLFQKAMSLSVSYPYCQSCQELDKGSGILRYLKIRQPQFTKAGKRHETPMSETKVNLLLKAIQQLEYQDLHHIPDLSL